MADLIAVVFPSEAKAEEVREKLLSIDYEPVANSPKEFTAIIRADSARWQKTVKERNFQTEK